MCERGREGGRERGEFQKFCNFFLEPIFRHCYHGSERQTSTLKQQKLLHSCCFFYKGACFHSSKTVILYTLPLSLSKHLKWYLDTTFSLHHFSINITTVTLITNMSSRAKRLVSMDKNTYLKLIFVVLTPTVWCSCLLCTEGICWILPTCVLLVHLDECKLVE